MFPSPDKPHFGVFVQEQVDGLKKYSPLSETKVVAINGYNGAFNYLKSIFSINWHLRHHKYDLIHIHYGLSGVFILFNPFNRTPVVLTLHGGDININRKGFKFRIIRFISRKVAKRSSKVIVVNAEMINFFNPEISSIVIPCGIDTNLFFEEISFKKNISKKIIIGFPSDPKRPEKNHDLFENIINLLRKDYIIETIDFINKTRDEVRENLNNLDLLLMTSYSEGSPQIVKEAMCCNIPVISTNVGDVKKLLSNVKNCYVIDSFAPEDFILFINMVLKLNQEERISNGREQIFSLGLDDKSVSNKIFETYQSAIKHNNIN